MTERERHIARLEAAETIAMARWTEAELAGDAELAAAAYRALERASRALELALLVDVLEGRRRPARRATP